MVYGLSSNLNIGKIVCLSQIVLSLEWEKSVTFFSDFSLKFCEPRYLTFVLFNKDIDSFMKYFRKTNIKLYPNFRTSYGAEDRIHTLKDTNQNPLCNYASLTNKCVIGTRVLTGEPRPRFWYYCRTNSRCHSKMMHASKR